MTRETKIGLLVGLAFIIVVGILLSDHMTSAIEPASAPLQVAGANLRTGLGQPASDVDAASNAPLAADTARVTPQQPVPTQEELAPKPPTPQPVAIDPPVTLIGRTPSVQTTTRLPVTLARVARESGEELVDADGRAQPSADVESPTPLNRPAVRNYKAQPGDSLSKMAARLLGANTKTNRDRIVAVNRTLAADPNRIIVGHTYAIPVTAGTPTATASAASAAAQSASPSDADDTGTTDTASASAASAASATPRRATADPEYLYTVKPGDTLWKIAVNELGDADTVPAIEELNQDVLKGAARIHPKMKLRLPAKPVAEAN